MSVTAYPTLRLKLTMPQALKLQFLPAVPGSNAAAAAAAAQAAAAQAIAAANTAVAATANKVDRTGDVMTGFLTLNADPTVALHAATKQYVDAHVSGGVTLSASQLAGRGSASGTGAAEAITLGTNLTMSGTTLNATGSGGGAPVGAEYITSTPDATLTAERVLTDTASVTWDRTTPGQIKANTVAGGGNVSNSGTPTAGQYGKWVTATTIQGVAPATVLSDIGALSTTVAASTYAPIASPTFTGDPKSVTPSLGDNDTSIATTAFVAAAISAIPGATTTITAPQGRLTLLTTTPVMTTTQSAKTTIYYTPYVGNRLPIYDGTNMVMTTFAELSVTTTDTTKSPAAIGASKVNDWFVWSDSGTVRIGHGPDWTSDTARSAGTALTMVNGIWLNNASITNGPAASRGTYVGTTRSNGTSTLDWIYGAVAANGTASFFGVWNCYNRRPVGASLGDSTDSWTYNINTWRASNASPTMRHSFIVGAVEDAFSALHSGIASSDGTTRAIVGVGVNSTTSFTGATSFTVQTGATAVLASCASYPVLGFNFVSAIELSDAGTATYRGDNGIPSAIQATLSINLMM